MRKTKIVCTLGPATDDENVLRQMMLAGMNTARFNFSHGDYESHQKRIDMFKKVREEMGIPVAMLLDTKGPEVRIKTFENGKIILKSGQTFTLTTREIVGNEKIVSITYKKLPFDLSKGNKILLDDGNIELIVTEIKDTEIICEVLTGGPLSDRKSMNLTIRTRKICCSVSKTILIILPPPLHAALMILYPCENF